MEAKLFADQALERKTIDDERVINERIELNRRLTLNNSELSQSKPDK